MIGSELQLKSAVGLPITRNADGTSSLFSRVGSIFLHSVQFIRN